MTGEKQRLTSTEWEVCECLWETSPLTITQIANALTARTGWSRSTGETLVRRMADKGLLRWEQGRKAKLYYPTVVREDAVVQETPPTGIRRPPTPCWSGAFFHRSCPAPPFT